jgi:hypothetical protein
MAVLDFHFLKSPFPKVLLTYQQQEEVLPSKDILYFLPLFQKVALVVRWPLFQIVAPCGKILFASKRPLFVIHALFSWKPSLFAGIVGFAL